MAEKPTIVLTHDIHAAVTRQRLLPHARILRPKSRQELKQALRRADGLITILSQPVREELLAAAPRLKVVANYAVGVDNVDLEACRRRGIHVVNTPGVLTRATAELALTLLLAAARRVPEGEKLCRKRAFKGWAPDLLLGLELGGRQAVILGQGRIGRETARLFEGIGLEVEFLTRAAGQKEIEEKLRRAQVLSLHVPLTPDTRHWLSAKRISLLPRDAIVINTARGPVVDEKALVRALKAKRIFAAGFDVYEHEPEIPRDLAMLDNVVLLPHLGSATRETRAAMAGLVIDGVLAILRGETPSNQVV